MNDAPTRDDDAPARIDAHHHFWDSSTADYPFLVGELEPLRGAFGPADLGPELSAAGIDGTVLVQARSSLEETRELLDTAERTPFVHGVVGWVDLTDPAVGDVIGELRAGPGGDGLVGIRHQAQDGSDWPVCLVAATYQDLVESARSSFANLSSNEIDAVFGGTATAVYRL